MLFEVHGLILALHHDARFLRTPGALERARKAFDRSIAHVADAGDQLLGGAPKPASPSRCRSR